MNFTHTAKILDRYYPVALHPRFGIGYAGTLAAAIAEEKAGYLPAGADAIRRSAEYDPATNLLYVQLRAAGEVAVTLQPLPGGVNNTMEVARLAGLLLSRGLAVPAAAQDDALPALAETLRQVGVQVPAATLPRWRADLFAFTHYGHCYTR